MSKLAKENLSLFLGSHAENHQTFENLWLEFFRDHCYWRRSFHPEDPVAIKASEQIQPAFLDKVADIKQALYELSAKLKRSVPFYHPRYIGHMSSELLIPGQLAQMITMLYNPNNVSKEAATVTIDMELSYGEKLCRLVGFDENGYGHLTSGGTVANYHGLWLANSVKHYPIALQSALFVANVPGFTWKGKSLDNFSKWQLLNFSFDDTLELMAQFSIFLQHLSSFHREVVLKQLEQERIETQGLTNFYVKHGLSKSPVILIPATAHYSWKKAASLFGLGTSNIRMIPVDHNMRMSVDELALRLEDCAETQTPVLAVIGVFGTTEYGTFDPIHDVVRLRNLYRKQGLDFYCHIDAAWGGFIPSVFRNERGNSIPYSALRQDFNYFPSETVFESVQALSYVESVTIDPHKQGYLPFGCGAFVCRDRHARSLLIANAPYVFDNAGEEPEIGQYILEGSKPGSVAAAAYVSEKLLPYHSLGLGQIIATTIKNTEYFYTQLKNLTKQFAGSLRIIVPIEPDSNLLCLCVTPAEKASLYLINQLTEKLYTQLKVKSESRNIHGQDFFATSTKVYRKSLSQEAVKEICSNIGISPEDFSEESYLFVIRHTLMNPWLSGDEVNYLDAYIDFLKASLANICEADLSNKLK